MARVTINPTFSIETGELLSHDGQFEVESFPIRFDRGAASAAKDQGKAAAGVAGSSGAKADTEYSSVVPGLIRQAQTPQGFTPTQLNSQLVANQEGAGGANATVGGEGRLEALRTKTAGGFAPALDEAARMKGRTLATGGLDIQNQNARLGLQRQSEAQGRLMGLYGTDTSNMLHSMGLQGQDLQNQLTAGRQGWLQNSTDVLKSLQGAGGKSDSSAAFAL